MKEYFAHETAVIDEGATIGKGTKIWHFCHVSAGAIIGENCIFGQGCFVANTAKVGSRVKVQNGVSIYDRVEIEDEVFCGPHMIFTNVINPRAFIERKNEYKITRVLRGATIGAGAVIVCGATVGAYSFVGAGAVVTKDVPDFALVVGNPARQKGFVGKDGIRIEFDADGNATDSLGSKYKLADGKVILE
ncbi:MAG: N-acetyltransferase [Planctomycetes bacterium]|nr:N-acetyltransferase [Planctomycetota bacterium]